MSDWISVKDRLPNKQGKYLVSISCGLTSPFVDFANWSINSKDTWAFSRSYVTAWQEIPEPYEEKKV